MKLTRKQLRKLILEQSNEKRSYGDAGPQASDFLDSIESPIQNYIDADAQKQDSVMKIEEERYGLPFTNRDIRLLLLSYVDKIQEIAASKDYNILSQINSRVLNYIDNLQLKLSAGTAAFPAYSNKIDPKLSMFYYQTPNVASDFKKFLLSRVATDRYGNSFITDHAEKIVQMYFPTTSLVFREKILENLKKIPEIDLLMLSSQQHKAPFKMFTGRSNHIKTIQSRIDASKVAIEEFQQYAEHAAKLGELGDDVGYMGTDLIEDFLTVIARVSSDSRVPTAAMQKAKNLAETELYDAMDAGELRKGYKLTRKLIRIIHDPALSRFGSAQRALLSSAEKILNYTDKFRFDISRHAHKLVRSIRASMEGFQSLFENKIRRNKMKLNRKQLRKMIMEVMDPAALELEITPQIKQLLSQAHEALKMSGHPLPHVVLNTIMVDLKNNPGGLAVQIVNKHLANAGASLAGGEQVMLKGLPKF